MKLQTQSDLEFSAVAEPSSIRSLRILLFLFLLIRFPRNVIGSWKARVKKLRSSLEHSIRSATQDPLKKLRPFELVVPLRSQYPIYILVHPTP